MLEGDLDDVKRSNNLRLTRVASLSLGILASALAELGVSHDAWVLAVEEDVLQGFILQIGALDDVL